MLVLTIRTSSVVIPRIVSPKFAIVSAECAAQLCQALVAFSTAVSLAFLRFNVYIHGPSRSLNLQPYSRCPYVAMYSRLSTSTLLPIYILVAGI